MTDVILQVEKLSKQYRLGLIGTGTISHDLNRWWAKVNGREDPFLKVGETNDRSTKGSNSYVWALENINFEVSQGEILGIIGKNGSGKSTLLKIISKVTGPTTGIVRARGRIASLLEVGTGFHPELTGRENIFLNGALLGMSKVEIKHKFDEIVDFAGIVRYVDTPVKRYSSGMYVRLGFAVAAFLEPEILIVDEVLAVGDIEFQRKAIGKMKSISHSEGRTVIFVSHNLSSIASLCNKCMLLNNGTVASIGDTPKVVDLYIQSYLKNIEINRLSDSRIRFEKILILDSKNIVLNRVQSLSEILIEVLINSDESFKACTVALCIDDNNQRRITSLWSAYSNIKVDIKKGKNILSFHINRLSLIPSGYNLIFYIEQKGKAIYRADNIKSFMVYQDEKNDLTRIAKPNEGMYLENHKIGIRYD